MKIKKSRKTKVLILVSIAILITGLVIWQFVKYEIVHKMLFNTVAEKSNGLYKIHYENLLIDEVRGTLQVNNIEIIPDTAVYNQMILSKKNPSIFIKLKIPSLEILGIKTPKALLSKEIEGSRIEISNPLIEIEIGEHSKDSTINNPGQEIYKELLGQLSSIKIDQVQINNATLIVRNWKTDSVEFTGKNITFLLSELLIDSTASKDTSRILFSKNLNANCNQILFPSKDDKYKLYFEKLQFTSQNNSFTIGKIKIVPQLSEKKFAGSFPIQKDRYDFSFEEIEIHNIDRESLWHKKLEADDLIIKKSTLKIYRDLFYPDDTVSQVGEYPQQKLMHLPLAINIKKVILGDLFLEYKERNDVSRNSGKVQFYHVHATINNITNIASAISENNICTLTFNARLLNKANFNAKLTLLLNNPEGKFSVEGDLGMISALSLNTLSEPMSLTRIEKGNINKLNFNFSGNDSFTDGKLILLYDDVKISVLKKNARENKYDKKFLLSLASHFIVKNSNPGKNEKIRVETVHYKRNLTGSFWNLIWKSIFTGVKQSIGVK
jgi:hypothetical protein